jgi:hypothetical protein
MSNQTDDDDDDDQMLEAIRKDIPITPNTVLVRTIEIGGISAIFFSDFRRNSFLEYFKLSVSGEYIRHRYLKKLLSLKF